MPDREKDKETLRIDRSGSDAGEDPDKTAPSAPPLRLDTGSDDVTAPRAEPVRVDASSEDQTAPRAEPVRIASAGRPSAPRVARRPSRRTLVWTLAGLFVVFAFFVLPRFVRWWKPEAVAAKDVELPPDPPLSEPVREAMRRGREAEDAMRLADARKLYHRAFELEPRCSSCALRLMVVERRIEAFGLQALEDGNRYLADKRYEEAAKSYQKVLDLVPDEKAKFNVLAKAGLADAREAAKRAGRTLP